MAPALTVDQVGVNGLDHIAAVRRKADVLTVIVGDGIGDGAIAVSARIPTLRARIALVLVGVHGDVGVYTRATDRIVSIPVNHDFNGNVCGGGGDDRAAGIIVHQCMASGGGSGAVFGGRRTVIGTAGIGVFGAAHRDGGLRLFPGEGCIAVDDDLITCLRTVLSSTIQHHLGGQLAHRHRVGRQREVQRLRLALAHLVGEDGVAV